MHGPFLIPINFMQIHLHVDYENINVFGSSLPGVPAILSGKNPFISWGISRSNIDSQDLFLIQESTDKTRYFYNGAFRKYKIRKETIKIRDGKPIIYTVKETEHGPIMNDILSHRIDIPIALKWSPFETSLNGWIALPKINRARNWKEFLSATSYYNLNPINFIYADEKNIGFKVAGSVPIRNKGHSGRYPVCGTGEYDWKKMIPHKELPQSLNPEKGFIVSANHKVAPDSYRHILSYSYSPGFRSERFYKLLKESSGDLSFDGFEKIRNDKISSFYLEIKPLFDFFQFNGTTYKDKVNNEWLHKLQEWDGDTARIKKSQVATVFYTWYTIFIRMINQDFQVMYDDMILVPYISNFIKSLNLATSPAESKIFIEKARKAFTRTLKELNIYSNRKTYMWGVDISLDRFFHPLFHGEYKCLIDRESGVGGGPFTIYTSAIFYRDGFMETRYGPLWNSLIAVGERNGTNHKSEFMMAMGQSGNMFSYNYDNFIKYREKGKSLEMKMHDYQQGAFKLVLVDKKIK